MLLTRSNLIEQMLETFPNLLDAYNAFDEAEKPLIYTVFDRLFKPFLKYVFSRHEVICLEKYKVMCFVERMIASPDEIVVKMISDTLIEEIINDNAFFEALERHFLPTTKQYIDEIKKTFDCEKEGNDKPLTAKNIVGELLKSFPCLTDKYEEFDEVEKTLLHIVFGQMFNPFVRQAFSEAMCPEKHELIHFMERMAISPCDAVKEILSDTVLEELLDDKTFFENLEHLFLPNTKQYADRVKSAFL